MNENFKSDRVSSLRNWLKKYREENSYPRSISYCLEYFISSNQADKRDISIEAKVRVTFDKIINRETPLPEKNRFTIDDLYTLGVSKISETISRINIMTFKEFCETNKKRRKIISSWSGTKRIKKSFNNEIDEEDIFQEGNWGSGEVNWGNMEAYKENKEDYSVSNEGSLGRKDADRGCDQNIYTGQLWQSTDSVMCNMFEDSETYDFDNQQLNSISNTKFYKNLSASVPIELHKSSYCD